MATRTYERAKDGRFGTKSGTTQTTTKTTKGNTTTIVKGKVEKLGQALKDVDPKATAAKLANLKPIIDLRKELLKKGGGKAGGEVTRRDGKREKFSVQIEKSKDGSVKQTVTREITDPKTGKKTLINRVSVTKGGVRTTERTVTRKDGDTETTTKQNYTSKRKPTTKTASTAKKTTASASKKTSAKTAAKKAVA